MKIITRKEARERGLKFYFTGVACKNGHISKRYTSYARCYQCSKQHNNTNKKREYMRRWYHSNKEHQQSYRLRWDKENPDKARHHSSSRRARVLHAMPPWADETAIQQQYAQARTWEVLTGIPMHVDHIIPLQGTNVCGLHCIQNLRVIPAKCNAAKSNKIPKPEGLVSPMSGGY